MIGDEQLVTEVRNQTRQLLEGAGIDPNAVQCHSDRRGARVVVRLETDVEISLSLRQALGVRVLDAVRVSGVETLGPVLVEIGDPAGEGSPGEGH